MTEPTSPALNEPVMSAERRALEIAVKALESIHSIAKPNPRGRTMIDGVTRDLNYMADASRRALADILALVPDAGGDGD